MSSAIMVAAAGQETKSDSNDFYAELLKTGMFSDLTLEVAGQKFKAHSVVLAAKSPEFARRIAELKEDRTITLYTASTILDIHSTDIVKNAISYCYTGTYVEPSSMPGDDCVETTYEIGLHAVIYMFSLCHNIAGLSEYSLKAFSTTATLRLQDPETKEACRKIIKDILSTSSTLFGDPQFMETVSQLDGFDLIDESSTWGEIKHLIGYGVEAKGKTSALIDKEGEIHNFSSWKCPRCGTIIHLDKPEKDTSPTSCDRPCPCCPIYGKDVSHGLTLTLTFWKCSCGAVWRTDRTQVQPDVLLKCPSCVPGPWAETGTLFRVDLEWICIQCKAFWRANVLVNSCAEPELKGCICCPKDIHGV